MYYGILATVALCSSEFESESIQCSHHISRWRHVRKKWKEIEKFITCLINAKCQWKSQEIFMWSLYANDRNVNDRENTTGLGE